MPNNNVNAAEGQAGIKSWVLIVPVVLIGLIFLPSAIVVGAAMVPTIVARVVDTSWGKRLSVTVGSFNLIGSLYFLHRVWAAGHGMEDIGPTLGDGFGWLCALVGAAIGWIIFGFTPVFIGKLAEAQTTLRVRHIVKEQERLIEEWGEPVRGIYAPKSDQPK